MNAIKHGILSREVLLPEEDPTDLADLSERIHNALKPVGEWEHVLVDRIVQGVWRLRRVGRVEAGLFALAHYTYASAKAHEEAESHTADLLDFGFDDTTITDKAAHAVAMKRLREAQTLAEGEVPSLGRGFLSKERTFSTLSRYEANIERGVFRAWHELERLQVARSGVAVPPPVAADVDVNVVVRDEQADASYEEPIVDLRNKAIEETDGDDGNGAGRPT